MIRISKMAESDIDFALTRTEAEDWGYIPDDFRRFLLLSPEGCFIARDDAKPVGIVTTIQHGNYGFIGTLIVCDESRGHGIGESLMRKALEHLIANGSTTIELDGVFPAVPLYRRLGFIDKHISLRLYRPENEAGDNPDFLPVSSIDSDDLLAFDRRLTMLDRSALLAGYLTDFSDYLIVAGDVNIEGYAFVRPRETGAYCIGPFLAVSDKSIRELIDKILGNFGDSRLTIGTPEVNTAAVEILRRSGFLHTTPSLRMYYGAYRKSDMHTVGIISAAKG